MISQVMEFIASSRHLGDNAELVIIKGTGHAFGFEKPKDYHSHLKNFLLS